MKLRIITWMFLAISYNVNAQIIDDSSILQAERGYHFVEGRFVAFLADTTSPKYVQKAFGELNISILSMQIETLTLQVVRDLSESDLAKLKAHPSIKLIYLSESKSEMQSFNLFMQNSNLTDNQRDEVTRTSSDTETVFIEFEYDVNITKLKEVMGEFRDVAYKVVNLQERTVTLQAEIGKEPLLMDKVNELNFVQGTAMVGQIGN